ncbi:alpha-N-acetyl-neuraminyl-2,3-beta-galactosyl-1,3-N-acetyl-galactosaminide alpha-2,6-sialyltransferase isoform X1 [Cygnus olor]|uniref:alpha-N-acetyl-neuraminyl-2,3-beta-galactosyl-1, 3-N-acetyl-galactosaminide alpha-2,6-sialyltransferase isoform X1 n=1 Tax=Cygnus olor TaxID=8869 RepID=UPI001ADE7F2E|nr:alpha-N-acetyl-neuraminyl-2,3-beta-galactosyl-1,3-N-acetyl-galactosaminide alpha-2,6-sialyltransferase isoform X1 [Cygnus olor]XP_040387596.1 alpha-N-acetyl-neuraminyl-2,3-beta-galactosyl-1,3-N-acetyl-galactosaminide alpha-2,6-sialyltransferase isoform X1 [Cygnus olor]
MKTLIRFFLALVCVAAVSVLYVLLCSLACLRPCCRAARRWDGPAYAAPAVLSFQGYSRVPDGQPLQRALCRRCAVVSSSGQMLGSRLGQAIDGQECVLRMNHAPTAGYEEDVGTRSTVRVVSHTSVPLLLRNQPYFFQQSQETVYVIWGPPKKMSREKGGSTYRALLKVMETYPRLQIYTLTEEKMAYCDDVFQNETGKNSAAACALQGEVGLFPEHGLVHHDPGHGAVRAHPRLRHGQRQLLQGEEPHERALPLLREGPAGRVQDVPGARAGPPRRAPLHHRESHLLPLGQEEGHRLHPPVVGGRVGAVARRHGCLSPAGAAVGSLLLYPQVWWVCGWRRGDPHPVPARGGRGWTH